MKQTPDLKSAEAPRNIEAERSFLAIILLEGQAIFQVSDFLRPDDFFLESHQAIYGAMLDLAMDNRPLDLVTIQDELQKRGSLTASGGITYVSSLMDLMPDIGSVVDYAEIIKEKSTLRRLIRSSWDTIGRCIGGEGEARSVLDEAEKSIFQIAEGAKHKGFVPLKEIVGDNLTRLESMERGKGNITGIPTDFIKLDELTSGLQKGDLIIVAGRPGMGKTAFVLNMAQNMAILHNVSVGFFSIEMSRDQLGYRLMCAEAQVNLRSMREGVLSKKDFRNLAAATDKLSRANIYIDDTPSLDVIEMRSKARRLKREKGLDIVVLDYLQLMKSHARFENRNLEIADISRNLKSLAKELDIPVVALSQLSRQTERRGKDTRPQLSDLRESGALEQDADLVVFLYREEVYNKETANTGLAEVIIAKQRNGPTGTAMMVFLKEYTKFMNYTEQARE